MEQISTYVHSKSDGCVLCLERQNDLVKDLHERPVILSIGLVYGTEDEMKNQVVYALERCRKHDTRKGICTVIEANHKSFRFPTPSIFKILPFLHTHYSNELGVIHFINVPKFYFYGIRVALQLIPRSISSKVILHTNISTFQSEFHPDTLLTRWGGDVAFDIDLYVEERCKDENVAINNCKRKFDDEELKMSKTMMRRFL